MSPIKSSKLCSFLPRFLNNIFFFPILFSSDFLVQKKSNLCPGHPVEHDGHGAAAEAGRLPDPPGGQVGHRDGLGSTPSKSPGL